MKPPTYLRKLGARTKPPFELTTPDPRFRPDEPVRVNGFRFLPTKDD